MGGLSRDLKRPTFFVIGAMKSGTTSLWRYLDAHPEIFMSFPKEPGFFVPELNWSRGWSWYDALFQNAGNAVALGDASTHYAKFPLYRGVAERIANHLPHARFIYVMREPVARAVSHYWHAVHYEHESRSLLNAVRSQPDYTNFGCYALQLEEYFQHFTRDRFLLITHEQLRDHTSSVIEDCYRFLGVDPAFRSDVISKAHNVGPKDVRRTRQLLHKIRWSKWWTNVAPCFPRSVKELAKRFEFTTVRRNQESDPQAIEYLRSFYESENLRLFKLLGLQYPEWD